MRKQGPILGNSIPGRGNSKYSEIGVSLAGLPSSKEAFEVSQKEMRFGEPMIHFSPYAPFLLTGSFHHSQISDVQEDISGTGQSTLSLILGAFYYKHSFRQLTSESARLKMNTLEF